MELYCSLLRFVETELQLHVSTLVVRRLCNLIFGSLRLLFVEDVAQYKDRHLQCSWCACGTDSLRLLYLLVYAMTGFSICYQAQISIMSRVALPGNAHTISTNVRASAQGVVCPVLLIFSEGHRQLCPQVIDEAPEVIRSI